MLIKYILLILFKETISDKTDNWSQKPITWATNTPNYVIGPKCGVGIFNTD